MNDASSTPSAAPCLTQIVRRKVVLCMGPGGVGKTTVTAALGLALAERGLRVVVVTIDPSFRLAQALGVAAGATAPGEVVTVPGTQASAHPLECLLLDTQAVFDAIVRNYAPDPGAAERILGSPIYRATASHLGGALEYAAAARVHMLVDEGRHDLIILDTPPTANAIEFLDAPTRIAEIMNNPAARFLSSSARVGGKLSGRFLGLTGAVMMKAFEALGGGPFVAQLGSFLSDFGSVVGEFQRRAGDVATLLQSSGTGVVLATSANAFSVREAKAFVQVLRERRLRVDGVVLNRVDPPVPPVPTHGEVRAALAASVAEPGHAETLARVIVKVYAGARAQAERTRAASRELATSYPDLPICSLQRRDPPPTDLTELTAMGWQLLGPRHGG